MSKGINGSEPDPRVVYADIIDLPHWRSPVHPPMSLYDRSAQFAAYKALTGYEDMIVEEARLTDHRIELDDSIAEELNRAIRRIEAALAGGTRPRVTAVYFIPDPAKAGGRYASHSGTVKRIDPVFRKLFFRGNAPGQDTVLDLDACLSLTLAPETEPDAAEETGTAGAKPPETEQTR